MQGGAHHSAEVGKDKALHGLHQVRAQGDWSEVCLFLGGQHFGNQEHTGGLPQGGNHPKAEVQVVDIAEDLIELVCNSP